MKALRVLLHRLRATLPGSRRSRAEDELNAELESHIEMHTDDNIRQGMSPGQARREAILRLGGVASAKESYRDRRGLPFVEHLAQDSRFALRQLRKHIAFSGIAVLILGLGLSASVAIFAFVDAAFLRPLPYEDPTRLLGVFETSKGCPNCNLSYLDFVDWKRLSNAFEGFDAYTGSRFLLNNAVTGVEPASGARVSSGFFRTLGVRPVLGRDFHEGEGSPSAAPTALLSYEAWQTRYAGRPDVVGEKVLLDGTPVSIAGVLPSDFHFAPVGTADFWVILQPVSSCDKRRSCHNLFGVARLRDGISQEAAQANVVAIAQQLEQEYPASNRGQGAIVVPLAEVISGNIRPLLSALLLGALLLLLIVWANVASLLLVRSESRRREFAVRRALGASTGRLVSQFFVEGVVITALGSSFGLAAGVWAMQLLRSLIPKFMLDGLPFLRDAGLSGRVILFAIALSLIAVALFAFTPALHLALSKTRDGLAEGARGSAGLAWRRIGSKLVVAELATAVVLLVAAGLLGKSLNRLLQVPLGFQPENLVTLQLAIPPNAYAEPAKQTALQRLIETRLQGLPGVAAVGLSSQLPVTHQGNTRWIKFVGRPSNGEHIDVPERAVSAGYFAAIGARLRKGRFFEATDDASKPLVAIINETFAREHFPGEDPIGKQIDYSSSPAPAPTLVIGVIDDLKEGQLDSDNRSILYIPLLQDRGFNLALTVRAAPGTESTMPGAIRQEIRQIDPAIASIGGDLMTIRIRDSRSAYLHRSSAWLAGAFAGLSLLLCVVGLYGVIAFSVSQRTREIGVRMALGAGRGAVYSLVLREAGWLIAAGLLIGLTSAVALARFLDGLLFGVSAWDGLTLSAVSLVLAGAALLAAYVPAHRAAGVNPVDALRAD